MKKLDYELYDLCHELPRTDSDIRSGYYKGGQCEGFSYYHHKVLCNYMRLDKVPDGCCVHHIDGDKRNNRLDNLVMMTKKAHTKLHHIVGSFSSR